jgi:hypothetical protein
MHPATILSKSYWPNHDPYSIKDIEAVKNTAYTMALTEAPFVALTHDA